MTVIIIIQYSAIQQVSGVQLIQLTLFPHLFSSLCMYSIRCLYQIIEHAQLPTLLSPQAFFSYICPSISSFNSRLPIIIYQIRFPVDNSFYYFSLFSSFI